MLDLQELAELVARQQYRPLFVTVSGAHLYGFPSPDSDIDLRGCHLLPLSEIVGLDPPVQTIELEFDHRGIEVELVSHDLGKYLGLLVKNNGYVLEQIFSPLIVVGEEFLDKLRPIARRCITRHHYHHYRGFIATERKLLSKQEPKVLKTLLYAYRVLLTGIHLLRTGEVEANLPELAAEARLSYLEELIAQKTTELKEGTNLDWAFHDRELQKLEVELERAYGESKLPEERDRAAVNELLVRYRLGEA